MNALILLLRRVRCLCIKELLVIFKDPSSRFVLVVPILVQTIIFGYAATYDLNYVPYVLCDQDKSALSRELAARLDATGKFSRAATLDSSAQAERWIYDGKALLAVHIGSRFSRELSAGRDAPVFVALDGRNSTTASIALGYIGRIMERFNAERGHAAAITLKTRAWFNPQLESRWNFLPAMIATLSLMQILLLSALSVAREREQGTFDQMLVTPLSPTEILMGKAIPPVLVGLGQSTLILMVSVFWFRIPFAGRLPDLYISLLVFTLSSAGIGLCLSAVSLTMQQAMVYCFMTLMPMILLSGFTTPVSSMPDAMQAATFANPLRFALVCVRRIYLEGASLADIAGNFIPMLAVAAATLPLAGWLFRNRLH
ncbi:MAG: ABC transporter permease [Mailhella sp.]|nr:ABC transporter permease [Mailhella sp.]